MLSSSLSLVTASLVATVTDSPSRASPLLLPSDQGDKDVIWVGDVGVVGGGREVEVTADDARSADQLLPEATRVRVQH